MRNGLILLSTVALSACNFAPAYRQPVAPVSQNFETAPGIGTAAVDLGWRDFFGDPRLQAHIAAALANNRDLAQAVARIEKARAQYRITETDRLPQLGGSADAARSRTPASALGGAAGAGAITADQFNLGVAVASYEIDFWGRLKNLSDAARARYLASVESERAFRLSLISQVAATYLSIQAGEERIALAEQTLAARREGLRIATSRADAGVTSIVDQDQAALLVTQAETEIADLLRVTEQAANLLTVLVGGPIADPLPPGRLLSQTEQFATIDAGLPSALLVNRPDILGAEQQLRAANADIGAARAAFLPNISLTGSAGFLSPALDTLVNSNSQRWSFGGALNLPIFDWGKRTAQLRVNEATARELTAAYERAVQGAFREVADALVGRTRYAEQIAAQQRAVDAQQRLARVARLRYDNGIAIYLEVLDAERNLFAAQQQLLSLRAAQLQNAVSLYVALGGGLKERAAS
jgi:multidrug efflux system outer membrane protein